MRRRCAAFARRGLWRYAFRLSGGLQVHGSLPAGGCVVVAEHMSHADTPALLAALDIGHVPRVAAAADYWFSSTARGWFCRVLAAGFPVRRNGGGMSDLREGGRAVMDGHAVVVFPGGSRDAAAGRWRRGAFQLAAEYGVPVVPVAIVGTKTMLPKSGGFTRTAVTVLVGAPIDVADTLEATEIARRAATTLLVEHASCVSGALG